ncbi:HAD-IIIA family hydrolase [Marinitoga sp. 1137]|uniref:HAD-IIIA family hydrolase n=1 Tax=Marinitoga sp. 1137 TaxID=1545835 RepID=UPI00095229E4|nr:HAD-IIIA family hydrolase [Marinitoga sp. 1137]
MIKQAVILAGGLGTRLKSVVRDIPKPMALIGDKPFLEHQVNILKENGFEKVLLLTGYKSEIIEDYFKDGKEFGIKIEYSKEQEPLGTGGAVFNAWKKLDEKFILLNGDTFFDIQYEIVFDFINEKKANALIVLRFSEDISRYGFVEIDENYKITKFIEKGKLPENRIDGYINGGIYYFKKDILKKYYEQYKNQKISIETDIFPKLIEENKLYGLPTGGKFIDIGIPEDYQKAQKIIPEWIKKERKPGLFIDRDGTIIEDSGYVHGTNLKFIDKTFDIIKKAKEEGKYVIIITNQAGIAKGKFTEEESIKTTEYIIEYYRKKGITIDNYYYCPYHPEGTIEKYKKYSLARKPNSGMILKACEDYRIDLKNSMMVGDNEKVDNIKIYNLTFVLF